MDARSHPIVLSPPSGKLQTPIYLKTDAATLLPSDVPAYHLLTSDGLFLCRNHPFFRSCVPAPNWPAELAPHSVSLELRYPKLPRSLLETVVGFFDVIGQRLGSEAAALLVWDAQSQSLEAHVPRQCGIVGCTWRGCPYPLSLEYQAPALPPHQSLIGDVHSHVDMPAFASGMDKEDELHRPGLHLVVGRLYLEPPEFHCEMTLDGHRFPIRDLDLVLEGYRRRRPDKVPAAWLEQVRTRRWRIPARTLCGETTS
jgi:PRTRC genetic system protein A